MIEFLRFLWERYFLRCRNVGWGECKWLCDSFGMRWRGKKQRILIDEDMCRKCYFEDYVVRFK